MAEVLTLLMAAAQVDHATSNGAEHPPVSEEDLKEAWLASCRTLYEVQPFRPCGSLSNRANNHLHAISWRDRCVLPTAYVSGFVDVLTPFWGSWHLVLSHCMSCCTSLQCWW